ncbi:MAG: hypothetical protein B6D56_00010 [Candidatus Omnitrophica bacterium 4484_70.1]|nr:MAG: hypothetical protein B6D56_00010 [Candidatus Omnitrophica bacterium 4484_70.1]
MGNYFSPSASEKILAKPRSRRAIEEMFRKFFCFARRKRSGRRAETLGGIVAHRATIKSLPRREFILLRGQRRDFVQNGFEFCPKGTANKLF